MLLLLDLPLKIFKISINKEFKQQVSLLGFIATGIGEAMLAQAS